MASGAGVLLDTHTLLWAVLMPDRLSARAARMIGNESLSAYVSAASAWEISTKVRLGKLPEAKEFEAQFLEKIDEAGYILLPIDAALALRAARLLGAHRDPFDRIIAAHALAEDIPVISADAKLDEFGVRRVW
jgi:PIN domain nuclease of toxin-antitoxin system